MSDEVYFPHIIRLMGLQATPQDPAAVAARDAATLYYRRMEDTLGPKPFLASTYSYADIAFYMASQFGERMGAAMTGDTPHLLRWRDRMTGRPAVQQVVKPMAAFLTSQGRPLPDFLSRL